MPASPPPAPRNLRRFRYRFESSQTRQTVRQGHFQGLKFALKKGVKRARRIAPDERMSRLLRDIVPGIVSR